MCVLQILKYFQGQSIQIYIYQISIFYNIILNNTDTDYNIEIWQSELNEIGKY